MEIIVLTFFDYPGTLMYLCILCLLYIYIFIIVYKINQIKYSNFYRTLHER